MTARDPTPHARGLVVMVVIVAVIAALTYALEFGALAYTPIGPRDRPQLGMGWLEGQAWVVLTCVCVVAQLIAAVRWSAWVASVAEQLEAVGAPGIDRARFRGWRALLRPGQTAAELLAISRGVASWTGAWVPERRALVIRVWATAWALRLAASLGAVLLVVLVDQLSELDEAALYVLCMLRDLALTVAAPALLLTVVYVHAELVRASGAADGRSPVGLAVRHVFARMWRFALGVAALYAFTFGMHLIERTMGLGPTLVPSFWFGLVFVLLSPGLVIAAVVWRPDRRASAA